LIINIKLSDLDHTVSI